MKGVKTGKTLSFKSERSEREEAASHELHASPREKRDYRDRYKQTDRQTPLIRKYNIVEA